MNIETLILITSVIGTIAFSISGALIAIECRLDIFGVIVLGCITACGGGILRDVMLNVDVNMFIDPKFVFISIGICILVFIIVYFMGSSNFQRSKAYQNFFVITDSLGLAAFVVVGANASVNAGETTMFAICFYGVLTAVGGGLIRDLMVNKIPAILRKYIYAIAAIIGAIYFYLLDHFNVNYSLNVITTTIIIVVIRYLAYYFELGLPKITFKENTPKA